MPVTIAGTENAKRNATRNAPTMEGMGMASAASSGSAEALMMPAAPPTPIIIKAATMRPTPPMAMLRTPRTRTCVSIQLGLVVFRIVLLRTGREVVHFDLFEIVFGAPVLVGVVQTPDGTLLDGTAWPAIGVLARRLALVLRRRVRSEIPAARRRRAAALAWPGS